MTSETRRLHSVELDQQLYWYMNFFITYDNHLDYFWRKRQLENIVAKGEITHDEQV